VYDADSLEDANELLHEHGIARTELDWERQMATEDGALR
jgi:hypothetical protein